MAKTQISIRIEEELKTKLNKMAKKEIRDLASMVRKILIEATKNVK